MPVFDKLNSEIIKKVKPSLPKTAVLNETTD